jgi:hypothetical protein
MRHLVYSVIYSVVPINSSLLTITLYSSVLHLTSSLTFTSQVRRAAQATLGTMALLFPLLARDSSLSPHTKLRLYTTIIRPMLTYGAPVWCSTSDSNFRTLQTVQNKCLRVIAGAPRNTPITALHASLGVETIQTYVLRMATCFYTHCTYQSNPLNTGHWQLLKTRPSKQCIASISKSVSNIERSNSELLHW